MKNYIVFALVIVMMVMPITVMATSETATMNYANAFTNATPTKIIYDDFYYDVDSHYWFDCETIELEGGGFICLDPGDSLLRLPSEKIVIQESEHLKHQPGFYLQGIQSIVLGVRGERFSFKPNPFPHKVIIIPSELATSLWLDYYEFRFENGQTLRIGNFK